MFFSLEFFERDTKIVERVGFAAGSGE